METSHHEPSDPARLDPAAVRSIRRASRWFGACLGIGFFAGMLTLARLYEPRIPLPFATAGLAVLALAVGILGGWAFAVWFPRRLQRRLAGRQERC